MVYEVNIFFYIYRNIYFFLSWCNDIEIIHINFHGDFEKKNYKILNFPFA